MNIQVDTLREATRGIVIGPDDTGYDEARAVRNGMIDKRPAVIVQPANAGDVMNAVRFAVDNSLTVAVRGGALGALGRPSIWLQLTSSDKEIQRGTWRTTSKHSSHRLAVKPTPLIDA